MAEEGATIFVSIFVGLGICTYFIAGPFFTILRKILPAGWFEKWTRTFWTVGIFYLAAGALHFLQSDLFCKSKIYELLLQHSASLLR